MTPRAHCPSCGGALVDERAARDFVFDRAFRLVRCRDCDLVTVDPVPAPAELARYYADAFYGRPSTTSGAAVRFFLSRRVAAVRRHHALPCRVLDVGCGDGGFLAAMAAQGCAVVGVETSPDGAARARAKVAEVHESLDDVSLAGGFDVITLWHVLEHVVEPLPYLQALRDRLAPGGVIVVAVPNFRSIEARLGGDAWFHLDVPRHLHHFSRRSLTGLLERAGFSVADVSSFSVEYGPFGFLQTALNKLPFVERNALYGLLKHGRSFASFDAPTRLAIGGLVLAAPTTGTLALTGAALQAFVGEGDALTAAARRAS